MKKEVSVFKLTWPIFIELTLQMLVGNMDQFMISRYSENSVAAIGNANQVLNLLVLTFSIISLATTILLTQYIGSNNLKKVTTLYTLSMVVNIVFSIVVGAVLVLFNRQIFGFMQVQPELMADARAYISIIGGFIFLQAVLMTFSAIFRSNTLMRETMIISAVVNIINVIGNVILINGLGPVPALGVTGAAISSNLSRFFGILIYLYLFKKRLNARISFHYLKPFPTELLKKLLGIGIPAGGENISYNLTQVILQKFINSFGVFAATTKVFASMLAWFSYLYVMAVSQASQIIIGYMIGRNELDEAKEKGMKTLKSATLVSIGVSLILWLLGDFIFGIFSNNPEVISLGKKIMFVEIFLEIGRAGNILLIRCLQVAGDIKFTVQVAIVSMWLISVGLGFLLGVVLKLGLVGVWIAMAVDELVRASIYFYRWKSDIWRSKLLLKDE